MSAGALAGIKVIDFGQMVSAPYCAKAVQRLRCRRDQGRTARRAMPRAPPGPFPGDVPHPEKSGLYFINNTNKRGITCDVEHRGGPRCSCACWPGPIVLIENNLPGADARWGLDYATLAAATRPGRDLDHAFRPDRSLQRLERPRPQRLPPHRCQQPLLRAPG
jgi:crotonobetainyl-CoA:carnitine CoA-transferase CaiB-like acyl-CoA transferase